MTKEEAKSEVIQAFGPERGKSILMALADKEPVSVDLLKNINGFDDVGIGVIWYDKGEGMYILCKDLLGYDLSEVQIYRYSNITREMSAVDELGEDSDRCVYCVKREALA